MTSVVDVLIRD